MRQYRVPKERREHSLGSGVIVNPNGYIVTNNHVIEGATDVKVALSDNTELTAKIVGSDPGSDIAILKIDRDHLTALPFADSSNVQVGDIALAMGVRRGTVSSTLALARRRLSELLQDDVDTDPFEEVSHA